MKNSLHTFSCIATVVLLCFSVAIPCTASGPKREMRATWFTTVANIDWPTTSGATAQKKEMLQMLDSIQALKMNVVLFHARPCADAFYKSAYEPWSSYLKVARGTDPGYDPLQFCIDECHKRGMACHAWMNPYRYSDRNGNDWTGNNDTPLNYSNTHPEWLLHYKSSIILDPGLPEVKQRVKEVVGDLLSKYDVDGIIFDDYFYPYGGTSNQDDATVAKYKPEGMDVHDWRRQNVNDMVRAVYDTIQAVKPWVTFGISPFGIWTTNYSVASKEGITLPANITGGNMYQEIYCDPVAWLKEGTIDYISPQLYWKIGGGQDYRVLSKWWGRLADRFGKQFYSSMAVYRYHDEGAFTVNELQEQTQLNRVAVTDNAPGAVLYNTRGWVYDTKFRRAFRNNEFATYALPPAINWKPAKERTMVTDMQSSGQTVTWSHPDNDVHFAVYAVPNAFRNRINIFSKGEVLLGVTYTKSFTLPEGISTSSHKIAVSVLDGYNNEYAPRVLGEAEATPEATVLLSPSDGAHKALPFEFSWQIVPQADAYVFQLARDEAFEDIVLAHETTDLSLSTDVRKRFAYLPIGTYYWRVKTRKANANDIWSEPRRVELSVTDDVQTVTVQSKQQGVYSMLGMYLGQEPVSMPHGVYVVNGKKVVR